MYLPITIFLLVFITEFILFLGYSYVTSTVHGLYVRLTKDPKVAKQRKLKYELLRMKGELSQTSSQDEFAKWAKMRRKLDKGVADLEKLNSEIAFSKTAFELKVKSVLWVIVHGSQVIMVMWYRKAAVFYLPPGWFGPAQRLLSLPFAPRGSVSVAVWFAVCRRMIKALALTANDFVVSSEKKIPKHESVSS
ncbi:WRB/Get1 family [Radiomyces spectabilis]|uniref:WRB/Get1 family n=1 Tax=Radiomyces spectabilis TaxID=64574 RepID=UPI00221F1811|nr:WRB/Get1 family [Radiomyces spectabilis]KAI8369553.1 WRB/Get1 family [Radiomyces spectabilis]